LQTTLDQEQGNAVPDPLVPLGQESRMIQRSDEAKGWGSSIRAGSVTGDVARLRAADSQERNDAARRIWERFAPRLCILARNRLNARIRVREDENDVVQSMFQSFFTAQQQGERAPQNRDELWRLLVWMTLCKVANAAHHHQRVRRDVRREQAPAGSSVDGEDGANPLAEIEDRLTLSPADEAVSRIELARMLLRLRKDLRQIIVWKLEGCTNAEIGRKLNRTERTVEMKMRLIREILVHEPWVQAALVGGSN
jgi:RNA polymerase sigma-70 factor (ECF subfamily)